MSSQGLKGTANLVSKSKEVPFKTVETMCE
jgi:hypothetical protein